MMQIEFARNASHVLEADKNVIGLAVGGSWITGQIDKFSDLDLIVVTRERISNDKSAMIAYAKRLGHFLTGFTGEHVGEPRVLICLYDNPLLHVDLKFVTLQEFEHRVESPFILLDNHGQLQSMVDNTPSTFPYPDYQWIEDRFWIWVHYALLKIGRGELFEALDFFGFLRMVVLGPLLHIKNGNLPRGVRKVETELSESDFNDLKITIPTYTRKSLLVSLRNSVSLYRKLRKSLFNDDVQLQIETEESVMLYFNEIESQN